MNLVVETDGNFSLFESDYEYCSFTNVSIIGNLTVSGNGIGGMLVHNIDKMTVYIVNTEINIPIIAPAWFSFYSYEALQS